MQHAHRAAWSIFLGLTLLPAPVSPAEPDAVLSARVSGDQLVISWPATHVGFVLECSTRIGVDEARWQPVGIRPVNRDGQWQVTIELEQYCGYFRLHKGWGELW